MEQSLVYLILAFLGLCFGSFAGATVWRLRARQLVEDKAEGEDYDKKEYKLLLPLTKASLSDDRSRCLHCGHTLAWYDLLPLMSWLRTGGKCRYCNEKIGWFEPIIEIATAALFMASYAFWPTALQTVPDMLLFCLWLVASVMLVVLFAYDTKWFLLPNQVMFPLITVGVVMAIVRLIEAPDVVSALLSLGVAIGILSGLYFVLWWLSKGQWIGFGDVKLGLALALLLGSWPLAFIALFAANFIGCIVVIPGMLAGRISRTTRVPFGPLLIVGGVIALFWGSSIVDIYMQALL